MLCPHRWDMKKGGVGFAARVARRAEGVEMTYVHLMEAFGTLGGGQVRYLKTTNPFLSVYFFFELCYGRKPISRLVYACLTLPVEEYAS